MRTRYLEDLRGQADRLFLSTILLLTGISAGMAGWHSTWVAFFAIGLPTAATCAIMVKFWSGRLVTRLTLASATMVMTALMIHQAHGMIELHFGVFVLLAALLYYRDWRVLLMAAGVIAVHHLGFDMLQRRGFAVWAFPQNAGFTIVLIHAAYVVLETALLLVITRRLRQEVDLVGADPEILAAMSDDLARGNLAKRADFGPVPQKSIAASMQRMAQSLESLLSELKTISEEQAAGDFSHRLTLDSREGVVRDVAVAINDSCDRIESTMKDTVQVLEHVGRGELGQRITADAHGLFSELKDQTNLTVEFLERFCGEQQNVLRGALAGELDQRIRLDGLTGYQRELASGLNALLDTTCRAISDIAVQLQALANGDLRSASATNQDARGCFAEIKNLTSASVQHLQQLVTGIRDSSTEVANATQEIAQANQDLGSRTESQAASLEQTSVTVANLAETVTENARRTREAAEFGNATNATVEQGAVLMAQVIDTMKAMEASSRRIGDIIGVIDGIAFQTNILALNASVEAARAGEQGRGFAVVAGEVRNLAQRSSEAAKEIRGLITETTQRITAGTEVVDEAGNRIKSSAQQVQSITALIGEIAGASMQQSQSLQELRPAIERLEQMTQQNAAMVEEAASAAVSLDERARSLAQSVMRFRLDDASLHGLPQAHAKVA